MQLYLSERYPDCLIAPMYHSIVKIEESVISTTVQAPPVCLPDDAMNELSPLRGAMYHFCLLRNMNLHMIVTKRQYEHGNALEMSVDFVLVDRSYNTRPF